MNKTELIDKIAADANITKAAAGRAVESLVEGICDSLKAGDRTTLAGFGTFTVSERKGRVGRNPQTGAEIQINPKKVVRFRPGKELDELLNG